MCHPLNVRIRSRYALRLPLFQYDELQGFDPIGAGSPFLIFYSFIYFSNVSLSVSNACELENLAQKQIDLRRRGSTSTRKVYRNNVQEVKGQKANPVLPCKLNVNFAIHSACF